MNLGLMLVTGNIIQEILSKLNLVLSLQKPWAQGSTHRLGMACRLVELQDLKSIHNASALPSPQMPQGPLRSYQNYRNCGNSKKFALKCHNLKIAVLLPMKII